MSTLLLARLPQTLLLAAIMIGQPAAAAPLRAETAAEPYPTRPQVLVFGKVSGNPKRDYGRMESILSYVVSKMKNVGIRDGRLLFARDEREMIRWLREGKIDWVTESVYGALRFREEAQAKILLKRWKNRQAEYHTVFFTRRDSPIHHLEDLRGKLLALEDPGSTTAFFLPVTTLIDAGLRPVHRPTAAPDATNRVSFRFARDELNIAAGVERRLFDAGAFSNADWNDPNRMPKAIRKNMRIFHRTPAFPRMLELTGNHLPDAVTHRLKAVLLETHKDEEGRNALAAYQETSKFKEPGADTESRLKQALRLLPLIEGALTAP